MALTLNLMRIGWNRLYSMMRLQGKTLSDDIIFSFFHVYYILTFQSDKGRRCRDRMVVGFTTNCAISAYQYYVVSSNPAHNEMNYSTQHYVIKFVSDFRKINGFLHVLRFPPPIKLTATITEILLKVALNTETLTPKTLIPETWKLYKIHHHALIYRSFCCCCIYLHPLV